MTAVYLGAHVFYLPTSGPRSPSDRTASPAPVTAADVPHPARRGT